MIFGNLFKLVVKALKYSIRRPIQRYNIANRAKKYLGPEARKFTPAPRAIGPLSLQGPSRYPYLEGGSSFKSVKQKRLEALQKRNQQLIESESSPDAVREKRSFSATRKEDHLVIETAHKLSVMETFVKLPPTKPDMGQIEDGDQSSSIASRSARPLPKSSSLNLQDPANIWVLDKVPPGRLDLNMLQELMLNKLADSDHWTPKQISERYNIKEEYAENLVTYLKQIRIVISPRLARILDYQQRTNPVYQSTKHIIYHVDKSLRSEFDRKFDATFLPSDELDPEIRELLDAGAIIKREEELHKLAAIKRPGPLRIK